MKKQLFFMFAVVIALVIGLVIGNRHENAPDSIDDSVEKLEAMCLAARNPNCIFSVKERTRELKNDYEFKYLGSLKSKESRMDLLQKQYCPGRNLMLKGQMFRLCCLQIIGFMANIPV